MMGRMQEHRAAVWDVGHVRKCRKCEEMAYCGAMCQKGLVGGKAQEDFWGSYLI